MNRTQDSPVRLGTLHQAADLLLTAAGALRTGEIVWGCDSFIGDAGERCLAAVIAWAADRADSYGDPRALRGQAKAVAMVALTAVAEHLTCDMGWPWAVTADEPDLIETVAGWQDEPGRALAEVISLLEATAEMLRPAVLDGAR